MIQPQYRKFKLSEQFINKYEGNQPNWGPLGYVVYKRTYSRLTENGSTEEFWQTLRRVVEGAFNFQKAHCHKLGLAWDNAKSQKTAQEMYDAMWNFKFLPAGRLLWMAGTSFVEDRSGAGLFNCAFVSTEDIDRQGAKPFAFIMDGLMLGVGMGFDTKGEGKVAIKEPQETDSVFVISDTREGWVESTELLLNGYLLGTKLPKFDYSQIRVAGLPIKGFGGTSSGPQPLIDLHNNLITLFSPKIGELITSVDIVVIENFISVCVISGNVRRCLPEDTPIFAYSGWCTIKNIGIGQQVLTDDGFKSVTAKFYQGKQEVISFYTSKGKFRCTKEHRVAVYPEGEQEYIWKKAKDISNKDSLVFMLDGAQPIEIDSIEESGEIEETYDIEVADAGCFVCSFGILVHNSAALAAGRPDDKHFVEMKHDQDKLYSHRYSSNNSILAKLGMDYSEVAKHTAKQGEPGYIWLENMRTKGRFKDGYNFDNVSGVNPSLLKGTKVLTFDGIIPIEELQDKSFYVLDINGEQAPAICWKSGEDKEVYEIEFMNRSKVYATPEHSWPVLHTTENGHAFISIDTPQLEPGMEIADIKITSAPFNNTHYNGHELTYELGKFVGLLIGDGGSQSDDKTECFGMCFGKASLDARDRMVQIIKNAFGYDISLSERSSTFEFSTINKIIINIMKDLDVSFNKEELPTCVWKSNDRFIKGLISGIFGSGANVQPNTKSDSVCLQSSRLSLLEDIKELLSFYGISGLISSRYGKEYETHLLRIDTDSLVHFSNIFSILNEHNQDRLNTTDKNVNRYHTQKIKHIKPKEKKGDVYDISVFNTTHSFKIACGITGNCGEQQLESSECCLLVESFPINHASFDEYKKTLKLAYLFAKSITLCNTHWPETNAKMLKNRRIGLSQSGIQQARVKFGTNELLRWCDEGYAYLQELDQKYSDWLCIPRSKRMTTVKPSGTVSLLPQVTPGIHFPEAEFYIRRVRFEKDSKLVVVLKSCGYVVEEDKYNKSSVVVEFPVKEMFFSRTKKEVSMWEQLEFAAKYQYYWSDNCVSITVTFKPEEADHIEHALTLYEDRLKTVSFLPLSEHGYAQPPYEAITEEAYNEAVSRLTPIGFGMFAEQGIGENYCDGESCTI